MSNNPKLATEQQVKDVSDTFTEIINHQGKQIKALESGVIDAIEPGSPAPTKRGEYKVTKVGVYINFKDANGQPISVTEEDYSSGNVSIIFNGTNSKMLIVPITFEGEVKEGDTRGVSGGEVYKNILKNNKIKKFTYCYSSKKYFYISVLDISKGFIRLDFFDSIVSEYSLNAFYLVGQAENENQKNGLEEIKLKGINTNVVATILISFTEDLNSNLLNVTRLINDNNVTYNEIEFKNTVVTDSFKYNNLSKEIISNTLIGVLQNNNYNSKIFIKNVNLDKKSKKIHFDFCDLNGGGTGVSRDLLRISFDIDGEFKSKKLTHSFIPGSVLYQLTISVDTKLLHSILDDLGLDISIYNGVYEDNKIIYDKGLEKLLAYNGDILKHQGYIVENGNTLTTFTNYQRFSDFIEITKDDEIKIISTGNNSNNDIFGKVVCICIYDNNLQKVKTLIGSDQYNFSHIVADNEKFIRCSSVVGSGGSGLISFRLLINRINEVDKLSTINAIKKIGKDAYNVSTTNIKKTGKEKIRTNNTKLPGIGKLNKQELKINLIFNSIDGKYIDYIVNKAVLQWCDYNNVIYFSANIGHNTELGGSDRTILFCSRDYGVTYELIYDAGEGVRLMQDWEALCLMVSEDGSIIFNRSEVDSDKNRYCSVYAIYGWKKGLINNGKDENGNNVIIDKKFNLSFQKYKATRQDLDFKQYGQTVWPDSGISLGSIQSANGRMMPGWSYNVYDNIVIITEYGEGDSKWCYENELIPVKKGDKWVVDNKRNGNGVSSKAWVSLDYGKTFKLFFDIHQKNSNKIGWKYCGDAELAHIHAINFNPYDNNFYITNGDISRTNDKIGYEDWMNPNQRILYINYEAIELWWSKTNAINPDIFPSIDNYNEVLPEWKSIILPKWYHEGFGYDAQIQLSTIEPFPDYTLFATDSDVNIGFFRLFNGKLDFSFNSRLKDGDFNGRSHFGGGQQYLKAGTKRLISLASHSATADSYIFSSEDGENIKLIYSGDRKELSWGMLHFFTENGVFVRPSLNDYKVLKLK